MPKYLGTSTLGYEVNKQTRISLPGQVSVGGDGAIKPMYKT